MRTSHLMTLCLSAGLAACGGSSTLDLKLFDAPPAGVTAVNIYIASMQVHVDDDATDAADANKTTAQKAGSRDPNDATIDDDSKWVSLTVNKSIDLVAHQGETAAELLGQLTLPEGKITQLRLVVDTTQPNTATLNGVACDLDMSRVAKKGIKINHVFKAFKSTAKSHGEVFVDFDLSNALQAQGNCFLLEPHLRLHKVRLQGADVALE